MTTQPDLITVAPSDPPALVSARRDLARALEDIEEHGDPAAELWLAEATEKIARLEANEIAKLRK